MDFSTQLLEHQVTAILLLDDQRQIHYANPAAEQLFSQSAQRMLNTPLMIYFTLRNLIYPLSCCH